MRKLLLFLFVAVDAFASTVSVSVVGTTPQQAVLDIVASDTSACTIQVSKSPDFSDLAIDVDPTEFDKSNSCARTGSIVRNTNYRMVIGSRTTATGLSGDIVSRSLQAYSTYYYKVTLASGATASGSFTTANPGLGNSAPDYIPYNKIGAGNYGWPSMHYQDINHADESIDPLTGFLTTRITGPGMNYRNIATEYGGFWWDFSNGSWGNACKNNSEGTEINHESDGTYCTYSGAGGPSNALFVKFMEGGGFDFRHGAYSNAGADLPGALRYGVSGLQVSLTGHGDPVNVCVTADGVTCVGNTILYNFQTSDSTIKYPSDSNWPVSNWSAWGLNTVDPSWAGGYTSSATVSGNTVTITDTADQTTVLPPWVHVGMHVYLLPNYEAHTITAIQDAEHFTVDGTVSTPGSDTGYVLANWGLLIWKTTGGTGSTSIESVVDKMTQDAQFTNGFDGAGTGACDTQTQLSTDDTGASTTPYTAKMCSWGTYADNNHLDWVWVPSTGEIRVVNASGKEPGWNYDGTYLNYCSHDDDTKYIAQDVGVFPVANSHYSCVTPNSQYSVVDEIKTAYPGIDLDFFTGSFGLTFRGVYQSGGSHPYALFTADRGLADVSYWEFVLDLSLPAGSGQVISAHNSWSTYPTRWGVTHYQNGPVIDWDSGGTSHVGVFLGMGQDTKVDQNNALAGEYVMNPTTVYNNTGTGTSLTNTFMSSCSALGVTDARWIAEENPNTGDNSCIKVNVTNEPLNIHPSSEDLTPLTNAGYLHSRPSPWAHNDASCGGDGTNSGVCYSYLQDVAEGDWIELGVLNDYPADSHTYYVDPSGEIDIVGKKTVLGNGTIDLVLIRGIKDPFGNIVSAQNQANGFLLQPMPALTNEFYFPLDQPFSADTVQLQNPIVTGAHANQWVTMDGKLAYQEAVPDFSKLGLPQIRTMNENYSAHGIRLGQYPNTLADGFQFAEPAQYPFNASVKSGNTENSQDPILGNEQVPMRYIQQHPGSGGTYNASASASYSGIDFSPMGGANGGQVPLWPQSATLVSGQSHTYLVQNPQGNQYGNCNNSNDLCAFDGHGVVFMDHPDPKRRQMDFWAGPYLLANISGPGSVINDNKPYTACYALLANECVEGSTPGQVYESVPVADINGTCMIDDTRSTPCWTTVGPDQAWGYQYDVSKPDPFGLHWRRVTMSYTGPGRQDNYDNLHGDSTGEYLYTVCYYCDNYRSDVLAVKVPPMPLDDSEVRNTFIPYKVSLSGVAGSLVRIRFGYEEYSGGTADNLYCSAERADECSTALPAGDTDPYTWLSETSGTNGWTACDSGCTITVPAIADRVLHYVIDRNVAGTTTFTSEQVAVIH